MSRQGSIGMTGEEVNMKKNSASEPTDDQLRQTTLWEFIQGEGAITTKCNHDKETGDLENNGADGSNERSR
jgi:hypothetical protein